MTPRIEILRSKKLVGQQVRMRLSDDKTTELWRGFMPRKREILFPVSTDLFCLQVFDDSLEFKDYDQHTEFTKWAAIEVVNYNKIPDGMEAYALPGGLYAVFLHKGAASTGGQTFEYIYGTWLPNSEYEFDNRAQFEILGAKYLNNDPNSEEEIWVPIKPKE